MWGDSLQNKLAIACKNELLAKVLCHNIVVMIHEMHELGIEQTCEKRKRESEGPAVLKFLGRGKMSLAVVLSGW